MASLIDERKYTVYTLGNDLEIKKKKRGTYSMREILEAVGELNGQNKNETYSVKEILEAVEALNEQN